MEITLYKNTEKEIVIDCNQEYTTIKGNYNCKELYKLQEIFSNKKMSCVNIPIDLFSRTQLEIRDHFLYEIYKELRYTTLLEEYSKVEKMLPNKYIGRSFNQSFYITKDSILKEMMDNLNNLSELIGKYLFIDSGNYRVHKYKFSKDGYETIEELLEDYKQELNRIK